MKRSALSRHTLAARKDWVLFLTFLLLEALAFGVAFAVPTKARLSILRWDWPHQPCIRSRPGRNHDCCFELPRDRGRQGTHSQSRGSTTPQRLNRAYPACEPE